MAHSEILLLKPIDGLGGEGDVVKVRAGYARNYLLPRNFALPVTQANRKHVESLRARRGAREAKELEGAKELATKLQAVSIAFAVKTGEGGKMFGSVTQGDLLARLEKEGYKLEKKQVHLAGGHVKTLGKHDASLRLHPEVTVEIKFEVVSENPIEEAKPAPTSEKGERRPRQDREVRPNPQVSSLDALLNEVVGSGGGGQPGGPDKGKSESKPKKKGKSKGKGGKAKEDSE